MKSYIQIGAVILVACIILESSAQNWRRKRDVAENQIENVNLENPKIEFSHTPMLSRQARGIREDMQKSITEFTERMQKVPDQLMGSVKKFLEERGITVETIQKVMKDLQNAIAKLIETVKQVFTSGSGGGAETAERAPAEAAPAEAPAEKKGE